jgi:hypothetical protein
VIATTLINVRYQPINLSRVYLRGLPSRVDGWNRTTIQQQQDVLVAGKLQLPKQEFAKLLKHLAAVPRY